MTDAPAPDEKRMRLRYAGTCHLCGVNLPAKIEAVYERSTKTVRCIECLGTQVSSDVDVDVEADTVSPEPVDPGTPGASARREYERRKAKREDRIRSAHPKLGGLIIALSDDPQSTKAWERGAVGEERLGARLDAIVSDSLAVLHDRRIPGSRANIDHVVVTPQGIWVIDAKRYKGRPHLKTEGGLLRPRVNRLFVGTRDCSRLVEGVQRQVEVVLDLVSRDHLEVPVQGVLCFVEADWPIIGGSFSVGGVKVLWPKLLTKLLLEEGESLLDVPSVRDTLAARFGT